MIFSILKLTNADEAKILQTKSVDVTEFNQGIRDLCTDMIETMYEAKGVGLAAPQVGRNLNIFVMRTIEGLKENRQEHIVLINPYTVVETGKKVMDREGCLSVPDLEGDVKRFPQVGCVYWDAEGNRHMAEFNDFQARIYQHEKDHLDGIIYVVRAIQMYKIKKNEKSA